LTKRLLIPVCVCAAAALIVGAGRGQPRTEDPQYAKNGDMVFPKDYREWIFLTSGLGMTYGPAGNTDAAANPRFDNVFVNPAAYRSFLQTGTWPDKTTMVLEVRGSDSKVSINNGGRVQTGIAAIEVHVKDAAHLPRGWGFFAFSSSGEPRAIPGIETCYSCHEKNGAVDTTFVQFYPTLQEAARRKGTLKASGGNE
jgi:Cytochrome P460